MLYKVGEFCDIVQENLSGLIDQLSLATNRQNPNEILAWQRSLPKLSIALSSSHLQDFHIKLGESGGISVEYKLPAASAWCDAVLLGRGDEYPSAVMIELKDWDAAGIKPLSRENLIEHHGNPVSHPSDQVRGYVEYCQNFHSTVLSEKAQVNGCVLITNSHDNSVYTGYPYQNLTEQFPVFSGRDDELQSSFPDYLSRFLKKPDQTFAEKFENGIYAQNRSLVEQIANLVLDEKKTIFVLLDEQRRGYELCLDEIGKTLKEGDAGGKHVIIIEGPPGSGKSVLAAKLWAALARNPEINTSTVLTSTSSAQNTNWATLFQTQAQNRIGRGVILKSSQYNPGLLPKWVLKQRDQGKNIGLQNWRENVKFFLKSNKNRMPDNTIGVSIVDEAHALIDPSVPGKEGIPPGGWCIHAGPQAYHIIRASRTSIFLMDPLQSYRDNETTTRKNIESWAEELGAGKISHISLGDAQFRCGGSREYVGWLDDLLDLDYGDGKSQRQVNEERKFPGFQFDIVADPFELDNRLAGLWKKKKSVRLVASYGRKWVTKKVTEPHSLPPAKMDFHIPCSRNGRTEYWSRIWNYAPDQQYQMYIQAMPGSRMELNPLSEVGCPYVVRGFDYDYLGVLWLNDLRWRGDKWDVNLDSIFETAWPRTLGNAKKEKRNGISGPNTDALLKQLQQGYRILLSRAIRGIFVWFEDEETREHVMTSLNRKI